jgi:phage protein D
MAERAVFYVSIDGVDLSARLMSVGVVTSITIKDSAGEGSDTCDIELDDRDGQLELPRVGAQLSAGLGWIETGTPVMFEGKINEVESTGGRGSGMQISVSAKSADTGSKIKQDEEKHEDDSTLKDVATKWGKDAGLTVSVVGDVGSIKRKYWSMDGESFMAWGQRTARENGATFKIMGDKAVFAPRSGGQSASGKPLTPIIAARGVNLIDWKIKPKMTRPVFKKFKARWYDKKAAKWKTEEVKGKGLAGMEIDAETISRYSSDDDGASKRGAESNEKEADREKGGGSVTIDGNPFAQAEAQCIIVGARPGVDGPYRIETATHKYERGGGYTTELELKQPGEGTGTDSRGGK